MDQAQAFAEITGKLSGRHIQNFNLWGIAPEQAKYVAEQLAQTLEGRDDLIPVCFDLKGVTDFRELISPLCRSVLHSPKVGPGVLHLSEEDLSEHLPRRRRDSNMSLLLKSLKKQGTGVVAILYPTDEIAAWNKDACGWLRQKIDTSGDPLFCCVVIGQEQIEMINPLPRPGSPLYNAFTDGVIQVIDGER